MCLNGTEFSQMAFWNYPWRMLLGPDPASLQSWEMFVIDSQASRVGPISTYLKEKRIMLKEKRIMLCFDSSFVFLLDTIAEWNARHIQL